MRAAILTAACGALVACASSNQSDFNGGPDDGGGSGSGADWDCGSALSLSPFEPVAGAGTQLHVSAPSGTLDNLTSIWRATRDGVEVPIARSVVNAADIDAPLPGVYEIGLTRMFRGAICANITGAINVRAPGALRTTYRLRIVAPVGIPAPISERRIEVFGGANADAGVLTVETRAMTNIIVTAPIGNVPAYLRFAPDRAPDAIVEAYSSELGLASVRLPLDSHTVLVVPQGVDVAPRQLRWTSGELVLDIGSVATGTLRDPAGLPLAGARIALTIDGVPATLGTTDASGAFAVRVASTVGAGTLQVEPPASTGLPRLRATGAFDLRAPLAINYGANNQSLDLAGAQLVSASNAPLANARVVVVGDVGAVGTVVAGAMFNATGEVYAAATTDGAAKLPSLRVARSAALSAVVSATPSDFAVVALDTSASAPTKLVAPAALLVTTALTGPSGMLPGSTFEAAPIGVLARAGAAPLQVRADAAGAVAVSLAAGGRYDLRLSDPAGRAAPRAVADATATTIATSFALPRAIQLRGTATYGAAQRLANASVQLLCDACTGVERTRPIAEALTDGAGGFTLAIPDPGTR